MYNILVCDDDKEIVEAIEIYLTQEGYRILKAYDGTEALEMLEREEVHLLLLDVMMPKLDGIRATLKIREKNSIPIIILSAKSEDADKILGLNVGADDYVTKPFKLLELLSRIRALIRRNAFQNFVSSDLVIDTNNMTVKKDNQNIFVTKTEFQILSMLIRNNGAIVTRSSLLQSIWDDSGNFIDDNTLSVHVSRLREKIGADKIATVRGIGYRWEDNI